MTMILKSINLSKTYQSGEVAVKALCDATFEVYSGEFIVVLGPSGSGKSTLLNIIGGMDRPTAGELYYKNQPLHLADAGELTMYRRHAVGFIFQFYNLLPNLTALENVLLAAELVPEPLDPEDLFKELDILDQAQRFPSQLSGGQQQRIAIARAAVKNPDLLLCDEPTGALDFTSGLQVLQLLVRLNQRLGKTVMMITHNQAMAAIAHRVFYLKDGRIEKVVVNEKPLPPEEVTW